MVSVQVWVAATPYNKLRTTLVECSVGTGLRVPHDTNKDTLELVVRTWLAALQQPPTRKRDDAARRQRARCVAGTRLRHEMSQRGVEV